MGLVDGDDGLPVHRGEYVLVEGGRGSAKTRSILTIMLLRALKYPGSRILLARSTRTSLTQTILTTLEDQVFPSLGMEVPGGQRRSGRTEYQVGSSLLVPMGIDDGARLYSSEWTFAYIAEAVELEREQVVELGASMRHIRSGERPYLPPYSQIVVDCNPGSPGHWLNIQAEQVGDEWREVRTPEDYDRMVARNMEPAAGGKWKRLLTRHQCNPGFFDMDKWAFTELGEKYVKGSLEQLTGFLRQRWLDGKWVSAEGGVFPEFNESRHVVRRPFEVPDDWPVLVGLDPGYDHPCAILWFAVAPNGCLYVVHESYARGRSVQEHAETIKSVFVGSKVRGYYADPQHAFSRTAQSPKSIAHQFSECGVRFYPWPRSTRKQSMVEDVRKRLNEDRLKVFATCQNTIQEFQSWKYRRVRGDQLPEGDDAFEDKSNDSMDVICGVNALPWLEKCGGELDMVKVR